MKQLRLFLLIALFIFWLFVGFLVADRLLPIVFSRFITPSDNTPPPLTPTVVSTPVLFIKQGTVLLIHVDDLSTTQPRLISIWAVFVSLTDQPSLIIKSIYPPAPQNDSNRIDAAFSLTPEGNLSPTFTEALKVFNFHWDNYVIYDHQALKMISDWITGSAVKETPSAVNISEVPLDMPEGERLAFENICKYLSASSTERGQKPSWQQIIPNHMRSDLLFDDTMVNWERITLASPLPHCEVLAED